MWSESSIPSLVPAFVEPEEKVQLAMQKRVNPSLQNEVNDDLGARYGSPTE